MPINIRYLFGPSKTMQAMQRAQDLGAERDEVERRYHHARAAYIAASKELFRFGIRCEKLIADLSGSNDHSDRDGTEQESASPRIVSAGELDVDRQPPILRKSGRIWLSNPEDVTLLSYSREVPLTTRLQSTT